MNEKTVIAVSVLTFLLFSAVSPNVMAQSDNNYVTDNQSDNNYITENQLQSLIENMNDYKAYMNSLLENKITAEEFQNFRENIIITLKDKVTSEQFNELSQAFQNFKDNAITQSELKSEINTLSSDLSSQISNLSDNIQKLTQEKTGQSLMLVAYGEQMKFLTFGGFGGGGMNPLLLMMSGGGGVSSMFQMKEISTDTPVLIMNNNMEMVGNAEINAYARGENGVVPVNIPTAQGMTFFPIKGRVFGSASAPGYEETSFFIQVGEGASGGGGQQTEVSFNDHLFQADQSNVVSITEGGNSVKLDSISISGPDVVSSNPLPSQGKIQFSVGSGGMYTINYTINGQSNSRTFATQGYGESGEGGLNYYVIVFVVVLIAVIIVWLWRRGILQDLRGMSEPETI